MPLNFIETALLAYPTVGTFNTDGLRAITIQGARYGGKWVIILPEPFGGAIECEADDRLMADPRYPDLAVESLFIWLRQATKAAGLRLVDWKVLNGQIPDGERPYFCAASAVFADATFVPAPGVVYADEWTLDRAMAASRLD